jgi:nitrogen-specific signal transduction histidine kinase
MMTELQRKIVRLGEGDLDVRVDFGSRNDEVGDLGRVFNHMVQQLYGSREAVERQHRKQMSRAECLATVGELATGRAHEIRNLLAGIAGVIEIVGSDPSVNSLSRAALKDLRAEIGQITRILTDLLQAARPHPPEIRSSDPEHHRGIRCRVGSPASALGTNQDRIPERPETAECRTREPSDLPGGFESAVERDASD